MELLPDIPFTPRPAAVQASLLSVCEPQPFLASTLRVLKAVFLVRSFLCAGQFVNGVATFTCVCVVRRGRQEHKVSHDARLQPSTCSQLHSKSRQQQQCDGYKTTVVQPEAQPLLLLQVPIAADDGMLKVVRVFLSHQGMLPNRLKRRAPTAVARTVTK